jgi:hypothetical protein
MIVPRTGGAEVDLHSDLPIDKHVTALGATWLDRTLLNATHRLPTWASAPP